MTTLTITPDNGTKNAELRGEIAAGEKVAVTVKGGAPLVAVGNLRLRIVTLSGQTVARFPYSQTDAWGVADGDATCILSLSTVEMEDVFKKKFPQMRFWIILDDPVARALYVRKEKDIVYWPNVVGEDVPVDTGGYLDMRVALSGLMDDTLADAATQKDVRQIVQKILAVLKAAAAGSSGSASVPRPRTVVFDASGTPHFLTVVQDDTGAPTTIVDHE